MTLKNTPRINEFKDFIVLRHEIYRKKEAGEPKPWTQDPILQEYRFCNVFRELDTVTIWVDENIRKPFADNDNLWIMLAIARYINWPETLQYVIDYPNAWPIDDTWKPEYLSKALDDYAATGAKMYTGAYMIRAESDPNAHWFSWPKHRYISEIVIGRLWADRKEWAELLSSPDKTLAKVWAKFQNSHYIGWGAFMAYEVVTDLRHTRYLNDAPDIMTWANAGVGAIRGLNRMYGRPLKAKPKPSQTNDEMHKILLELKADKPAVFEGIEFEMRDVEHCLCEFDKYERVRLGEGRPRTKYDGKGKGA